MSSTRTQTETSVSRKGDLVTVTTVKTITTTQAGKDPVVKKEETVQKYDIKNGLDSLPDDLRKQLEDDKAPDVKDIDFKACDSDFEKDLLKEINKYRKTHHVKPLEKSDKVSKYAQERAKAMADKDEMVSRTDRNYGECVTALRSNDPKVRVHAEEIAEGWYEGSKDYDFKAEPKALKAGNFTQMVWKESEKFGVGAVKSKTNRIYVVAAFDPPGNYTGEFTKNVLAQSTTFCGTAAPTRKEASSSSSDEEDGSGDSELDKFNKEGVRCHNEFRKKHHAPPLKYSPAIGRYAQEWANYLASTGKFEHRPSGNRKYGENLYAASGRVPTASCATKAWYDEIKDYRFGLSNNFAKTGHFTQVVWKATKEMGMGKAVGRNGMWVIVASYDPPGNFNNLYNENVLRP